MFSLDDRAGNVITTLAVFVVAATILYVEALSLSCCCLFCLPTCSIPP
jgi:hypothetical protein